MTVTPASFRTDYPEFSAVGTYPDSAVGYWITFAGLMLRPDVYGSTLDVATELFVAHNLVLELQAQQAGAGGGPPVGPSGPLASRAVGPVSKSYDTTAAIDADAGHWNLTTYGTRFIRLASVRAVGRGPSQVGPCGGFGPSAWGGPPSGFIPGY